MSKVTRPMRIDWDARNQPGARLTWEPIDQDAIEHEHELRQEVMRQIIEAGYWELVNAGGSTEDMDRLSQVVPMMSYRLDLFKKPKRARARRKTVRPRTWRA
jgi:hypothetical protein